MSSTIKQIERMSKNIKIDAEQALHLTIDSLFTEYGAWVVSSDLKTIENDEYFSGVAYYRNGSEIIAVPTFYHYEGDGSIFQGSRGNYYELNGETLTEVA